MNAMRSFRPGRQLRPFVVALAVFLFAAAAASLIRHLQQDDRREERTRVSKLAGDQAHTLQGNIERALSAAYALAALVHQGHGVVRDFAAVAVRLLPLYPGADSLQLAPGGVIRNIAPLAGNERAIGHELLRDPARTGAAFDARDTGKLTLDGPFDLIQGGVGAVGRLPVFLDDAKGKRSFWGFASVVIRFPEALEPFGLLELAKLGLAYELWRVHPATGRKQIIAASPTAPVDPVERAVQVPNATWTLSVAPVEGWRENPLDFALETALGLLFSLLLAYLAKLLVDLRAHEQGLEALVAQRTAELRLREQALHDSAEKLRLFADNVPAMTVSWDEKLHCRFANKPFTEFFGFTAETILGRHLREVVGEEAYREIEGYFEQVLRGYPVIYQRIRKLADGESRYLEVKLLPHIGDQGNILGCFAVTTDITEHKLAEERIQRVAHHDSLTGLPNRLLFNDRLNQAISFAKRDSRQFGLLYLDLDKFKPVNDTLGHIAGDELLQSAAERIRRQVRESDTVARVGGDEFTVILPDIARREEAETVARKVIAALAAPFQLGNQKQSVEIGTSIGIAIYPADARDADALVKAADAAMYSAKQAGSSFRFCGE